MVEKAAEGVASDGVERLKDCEAAGRVGERLARNVGTRSAPPRVPS